MRHRISFFLWWVVLSALAEWAAYVLGSHFYYYVASSQAADGQRAAEFIILTVAPIFVFVVLMLFYAIIPFRYRKGQENKTGRFKFNKVYVTTWITLSLLINLMLFVHPTASAAQTYFNDAVQTNKNPKALVIDVTARQWEWKFSYPQYGISQAVDKNGEDILVLPKNRPVKFVLRSFDFNHSYDYQVDVIHSFWIPAFGMKTDVIPGETRYEYITPTKINSTANNPMLRVQCAEVCGPGHPFMESSVKVVSPSNFSAWVQKEKKMQGS
jgi:cytochrome c oxidase subunit 2